MTKKAIKHPALLDASSIPERTLSFLMSLIRYAKPSVIVEAGTYKGHFALTTALMLKESGLEGHLWTADPIDFGMSKWIEEFDLAKHVTYFKGDFEAMIEGIGWPIDFAFIDSGPPFKDDASFEKGVRFRHYRAAKRRMRRGGIIIVDDMNGCEQWQNGWIILAEASVALDSEHGLTIWQAP